LGGGLKMSIEFITTPHERERKIKDQYIPKTEKDFYDAIKKPLSVLKTYGFGIWDSLSELVKDNLSGDGEVKYVSFPSFNMEGEAIGETTIKVGADNRPLECKQDKWVVLFPVEWFDVIPDGFNVIGLYGEQYQFNKFTADNDCRFGCLGYGILVDKED
jgi:hypothetical protein